MREFIKIASEGGIVHIIPSDIIGCTHLKDNGMVTVCSMQDENKGIYGKYLGTFDYFSQAASTLDIEEEEDDGY